MKLESFNRGNCMGKIFSVTLSITLATGIVFGAAPIKAGAEEGGTEVVSNVEESGEEVITGGETVTTEEAITIEETTAETISNIERNEEETTETETNWDDGTLLVGYYQTWDDEGNPFIKLGDVDKNWDVINVAYAEPESVGSTDGKMKFEIAGLTEDYTEDDFKADIRELQEQGKKILLSIGGDDATFTIDTKEAAIQFVMDIESIVDEYGFDGIDIAMNADSVQFDKGNDKDINNPTSPIIVNIIYAISSILDNYGDKFVLTMTPKIDCVQGGFVFYAGTCIFTEAYNGSYLPIINAFRERLEYVNVKLYDFMGVTGPDWRPYNAGEKESVIALPRMLLKGFYLDVAMGTPQTEKTYFAPLSPSQIVVGVPVTRNSASNGFISNGDLQQAFSELNSEYKGIKGIAGWSINWDSSQNKNSFANLNKEFLELIEMKNLEEETSSEEFSTEEITTDTEHETVAEESTSSGSQEEETTDNIVVSDLVTIEGCQISATVQGMRTIYSVEGTINDKEVVNVGMVYSIASYATEEELYVGSESGYVRSYQATSEGVCSKNFSGSETAISYAMTMKFSPKTAKEYSAEWRVRAYAELEDGTYVYSDIVEYTIYEIADLLYQNGSMNTKVAHEYLYTDILKLTNPEYEEKEFEWINELV